MNNLGRAYEGQGKWDLAAEAYGRASDRVPTDTLFAKNASVACAKVNNEAMTAKFAERAGTKPTTQFDLARVQGLLAAQKYDEALTLMNDIEPRFAGSAPFYFNKGVVYQKKGDYQKAVESYRKSRAIREEDATIKNLTIGLYQAGDYAGARIEAETYIRRVGRTPEALQNLGAIAAAQGRREEAVAIWKELLNGHENTVARLDLADALWNSGNTQEARFHYAKVLSNEPSNARAHNGMGLFWLSLSKLKEAESSFRAAVNADRNFATGQYNLGIALERQNRLKEARAAFGDALSVRPDYPEAKRALERLGG
jgi:tetratricopeptide (TPR) repeat protein